MSIELEPSLNHKIRDRTSPSFKMKRIPIKQNVQNKDMYKSDILKQALLKWQTSPSSELKAIIQKEIREMKERMMKNFIKTATELFGRVETIPNFCVQAQLELERLFKFSARRSLEKNSNLKLLQIMFN